MASKITTGWKRRAGWVLCLWLGLAGTGPLPADDATPANVPPIIQRNYDDARRNYEAHPDNDQAAWQFGRACFDRAEYARDSDERAHLANEGIDACRKVVARNPSLAEGHYYLGMDLAQLARTKLLGALPLVREMEREWLAALALNDKLDHAGPDRLVGLLYRDAPGRPLSVGNDGKARRHLLHAVEVSPNFPENQLNLIETYLQWKKTGAAASQLEKLRKILPAARKEFAGDYWALSWKDWDTRLERIEAALETSSHPAPPVHER